jgi:DNA-binding beta-propeller fold protein YncE
MTTNRFRRIALGLDGAVEGAHMAHPDFRANGRIFATLAPDGYRGMVKLTPDQQRRFVAGGGGTFEPASGAWGRQGCTMVVLETVDEETLGEAMTLAWRNAVSAPPAAKRRRRSMRKRTLVVIALVLLGASGQAQRGGPTPEQQAAIAKQDALEKSTPRLQVTEDVLNLVVPNHTIGEAVGVAKNSKGNLFVFTRSGNVGPAKGATASQLFEFDPVLKFVKQWGPDNYAASFAHTVRVDKQDNVWMTDEGANMIVKFNPQGHVAMVLGRKTEAIDYLERFTERGEKDENRFPAGNMGTFNRPTDVTWSPQGDIFVSDGYNNSRVVKIAKDGTWVKAVGTRGAGPNQFNTPHAITADAKGNIYVADRGNRRIQVFDSDLNPVKIIANVGAPWSVCMTPAPTQYLFSGDGNGKLYKVDPASGNLVGWAQVGLGHGQTGCLVHELHCESETVVYKGDCSTWTVEKITIKGTTPPSTQ